MKRDIYQEVTDQIIAALEAGTAPWVKPWKNVPGAGDFPHNYVSGRAYSGVNVLLLWGEAMRKGYQSSAWLTFKQAKEKGGHVRKGEKGTQIVFWKFLEKQTGQLDDDGNPINNRIPMCRAYTVFNVEQCEGIGETEAPAIVTPDGYEHIEETIQAIGADVRIGGNRAFFSPGYDFIQMPAAEQFQTPADYYATLMHEHTHWTGHKSRLDRDMSGRFGDEQYAAEELVAEIGAAFVCARLGIEGKLQHAEYIASWLKVLKNDKRAIFTAASHAQKAADYLLNLAAGETSEIQEAA